MAKTGTALLCCGVLWGASTLLCGPCRSAPARPVVLELDEDLPFSAQELTEAIALRVPLRSPASRPASAPSQGAVSIRRAGEDAVRVQCGHKHRLVRIAGLQVATAMRLLALAVADLVGETLEVPVPPMRRRPVTEQTRPPVPRAQVSLQGLVGGGSNLDRPAFTVALDGSVRLWATLRGVLSAGAAFPLPAAQESSSARLTMMSLRAGLGWMPAALPWLEARLTAVLLPFWLAGEKGERPLSHDGILAGAGLAALFGMSLTGPLFGSIGLGAEVFFNRLEFQVGGDTLLATERVAFWAGLGLGYRL